MASMREMIELISRQTGILENEILQKRMQQARQQSHTILHTANLRDSEVSNISEIEPSFLASPTTQRSSV
jgi:hypothetical protein